MQLSLTGFIRRLCCKLDFSWFRGTARLSSVSSRSPKLYVLDEDDPSPFLCRRRIVGSRIVDQVFLVLCDDESIARAVVGQCDITLPERVPERQAVADVALRELGLV